MRSLSTAITAASSQEAGMVFALVKIGMAETTYHYTECDVSLEYGGDVYDPIGMELRGIESNSGFAVDSIGIDVDNVGREMSAMLLNEDAANRQVTIYAQWLTTAAVPIDTVELFSGYINEWALDDQRARFEIANEIAFWHKKALRLPTPNCPWAFKGVECAYAGGSTWCDKSPERCVDLSNYSNFGGRKFINSVENLPIYWAPK